MVTKNSSERASRRRERPASSKRLTDRKKRAEREYARVLAQGGERKAAIWKFATDQLFGADNLALFDAILRFERIPVTIDEFVESARLCAPRERPSLKSRRILARTSAQSGAGKRRPGA